MAKGSEQDAFYDDTGIEEDYSQRGSRGYRRGRSRRGGYGDSGRYRRGRGGFGQGGYGPGKYERGSGYQSQPKGFRDSDCNYHLQEKFKDEFDFSKHELQKEEMSEAKDNSEKKEEEEAPAALAAATADSVEPSSTDGFFDDFSNSNLANENEEGRGERRGRGRGGRGDRRGGYGGGRGGYDDGGYHNKKEGYNDHAYSSNQSEEFSFPEYVAPQVHYRGARRGTSTQGYRGKAERGRFSGFSSLQDD